MGKNRPTKKKKVSLEIQMILETGNKMVKAIENTAEAMGKKEDERIKINNSKDTISIIHSHNSEGIRDTKVEISFSKETSKELKSILRELKVN